MAHCELPDDGRNPFAGLSGNLIGRGAIDWTAAQDGLSRLIGARRDNRCRRRAGHPVLPLTLTPREVRGLCDVMLAMAMTIEVRRQDDAKGGAGA